MHAHGSDRPRRSCRLLAGLRTKERPLTDPRHRDRVLGSLLGLAVGDCLGAPFDELGPATLHDRHFEVSTDLLGCPIWTNGTQQALTLVEATVRRGSPDPSWIGQRWIEMAGAYRGHPLGVHRDADPSFFRSIAVLRSGGDWRTSGQRGRAGCASAVRVIPVATALEHQGEDLLAATVIDVSLITHRGLRDISAALAVAWTAARLSREPGYPIPAARGRTLLEELAAWLRDREERLLPEVEEIEVDSPSQVHDVSTLLAGIARRRDQSWRSWIERYASARLGRPAHASESCALCSVPTALAIVLASGQRFEESLLSAIRLGRDASTVGALVGGLAGAAGGEGAIPTGWRGVEGWEVLVAWADALACCTSPAEPEARPAEDCPLPQDLPDILALEQRLTQSPMREESPLLR